jgi:hypothetical protein
MHFVIDPRFVQRDAQRIERSFSECAELRDGLGGEAMKRDDGLWFGGIAPPWRRVHERAQECELDREGTGIVLAVRRYDAAAVEREEQFFYRGANDRYTTDTLIAAPRDDQYFLAPAYLLLAQPGVCATHRVGSGGQMLPEIERTLRSIA